MTGQCPHPNNHVVIDQIGGMKWSGGEIIDNTRYVYFCNDCHQVIEESEITKVYVEETTEFIPV